MLNGGCILAETPGLKNWINFHDKEEMKLEKHIYFAVPITIGMLFWNAQLAIFVIPAGILYFLYSSRRVRLLWNSLSQPRSVEIPESAPSAAGVESEPTLITLVARAPYQLLGVDQDAGTSTIFSSFHQQARNERNDSLRLNKKGRRLAAAKNEMLARRRKQGRPESSLPATAQKDLKNSLRALLADRPVYSGEVVQFSNLSSLVTKEYQVGAEIEELGHTATCGAADQIAGRGSSRFVIQSQTGRLLNNTGEGQVVFLPGTRFLIVARQPWQNPDVPGSPPGFTFELVEVA